MIILNSARKHGVSDAEILQVISDPTVAAYRGEGLGKALVKHITEHELLAPLRGILDTSDAHGLYEKFGFVRSQGMNMSKPRPIIGG